MILKIKDKLMPIIVDRIASRLVIISLVLNILAWVLILVRLFPFITDGRMIALHYNVYLNVNDVGPAVYALVSPAIGLLILVINLILAVRVYSSSRQNAVVLLAVTLFYELLTLVAVFFMILINLAR